MNERDHHPDTIDPYAQIAELYDLEHDDYDEDLELYLGLLESIEGPILEMGSGSGRLLLPIAAAGHRITGLDASPNMLQRARQRIAAADSSAAGAITLFQGGMQDATKAPGGPFGLVLFSLNALMHLDDPAGQRAALVASLAALRPGGHLVIDTMNPTPEQLRHLTSRAHLEGTWTLDRGEVIDKWSHREHYAVDQILDTVLWYDRVARDGGLRRTRTQFPLRYVYPQELELMLELAGFSRWNIFGNYELGPLTDESDRIIVIADKAE